MIKKLNVLMLAGALLFFAGLGAIVINQNNAEKNFIAAMNTAEKIQQKLPPANEGIDDMYYSAEMPTMSVGGVDYIALVETEKFGVKLPVAANWNKKAASQYPCRFTGSCYDKTMVIGAGEKQFEFAAKVDIGDRITVTDMLGYRFNYTIDKIIRVDSADAEKLLSGDYPLTLFAPDSSTKGYIVVRCK